MKEIYPAEEKEHLIARSPAPAGINQYAGEAVLIRNGEVVVDQGGNPLGHEHAEPDDTLYFVPLPGDYYLIDSHRPEEREDPLAA